MKTPLETYKETLQYIYKNPTTYEQDKSIRLAAEETLKGHQENCKHHFIESIDYYNKPEDYYYTEATCKSCGKLFKSSRYHFDPPLPQ